MGIKKASADIQLLVKEASKPGAIIRFNGMIDQVNDTFLKLFGIGVERNIQEIFEQQSLSLFERNLKDIKCDNRLLMNVNVIDKTQKLYAAKINLMYCGAEEKIKVMLDLPGYPKNGIQTQRFSGMKESDSLMIVANLEGCIEDINELTNDYFHLPREYFIGRSCKAFFKLLFGNVEGYESYKHKVLEEGYAEIVQPNQKKNDDDIRYYKVTSFYDKVNALCLIRISDYTERELRRQDLVHKGSLSEVGQLAANIAHEIRNPMTTLKGFTQLLKESANEESLKYLTVIDDEIIRIESILSEMLFLSKPSTMEKKLVCPKKLLEDIIHIIYPTATYEGIEMINKIRMTKSSLIYGEEGKLKQVLLNLLKNALEAMTAGGILTITMFNENDQLKIIIEDTGKGMDETQLSKVFSPYFTTREKGTGLGLPFVLKTIEGHGGTVTVSSQLGIGSRFVIHLPIKQEKESVKEIERFTFCMN